MTENNGNQQLSERLGQGPSLPSNHLRKERKRKNFFIFNFKLTQTQIKLQT